MKNIYIIILILSISIGISAQEVLEGISNSGYVNITTDPPKPALLEISSIQFMDTDGNMKIDASEQCYLYFDLKNTGLGPGLNLILNVEENNNIPKLNFDKQLNLGKLEVGENKQVHIPISSGIDLPDGKASFYIKIDEANGFDSDPITIEVKTGSFKKPQIEIVDYRVSSTSGTILERKKPFFVDVIIQNVGEGDADLVNVVLPIPNGIFCMSQNENFMIGKLQSGEQHLMKYELYTNSEYNASTIPLNFKLSEKYKKYSVNRDIVLEIDQSISTDRIIVNEINKASSEITIGTLTSKVDKNIPINPIKNPYRIALIIGNEDYSGSLNAEINVDFARNDADIFRQYVLNVLGVEEKNITFLLDATAGKMNHEIDKVTEMMKVIGDKGELIFYYAGHGYPDEASKTPYLIPVDVNATYLNSAIKLSDIYDKFGSTGAAKVTIFLDACFSGGGRNQGLLAARSVKIKPKTELIKGNTVVFSASSGTQTSLPYKREKHGMFTYFLLKKIQETNGDVTYGELAAYLDSKVRFESLRENDKQQDPEVNVSRAVSNEWKNWKLK